jgi:amidophosphoribosyltransferase
MIKDCGAREVHVRIASPPVRFPCYYGIDTPTCEDLAAAKMDTETLSRRIGADSLAYINVEDMIEAIGLPASEVCTACFTGEYLQGGDDYEMDL